MTATGNSLKTLNLVGKMILKLEMVGKVVSKNV